MILFGTGGWRAEIGSDFVLSNIKLVAQGISDLIKSENKTDKPIIVGYDRRFLSKEASVWLCEVFSANNIKVLITDNVTPTPLIMHYVKKNNLYYGVEITASHNPSNYNGIKLIVEEGRDASVEVTNKLENLINNAVVKSEKFDKGIKKGNIEYVSDYTNDFIDDILNIIDIEAIKRKNIRVLFDPMHGASLYPFLTIFYSSRCIVDCVNSKKDAFFGDIMPAPNKDSLKELANKVLVGKYDIGIGIDGDGDRIGIIDSNGRYINANEILCLLYYYLHEYKHWRGPVVRNLATTHLLDVIAESLGESCYEVPVGFKYISSKIDEVNAILGGESSGGLTVRGHIHGKDSIYASILFVEMLCKTGKTATELLEEMYAKYGSFHMEEMNLSLLEEEKEHIKKLIIEDKKVPEFENKVIKKVSYVDGCKIYFEDNSFIICRFSGTEPLLRIFAESKSKKEARNILNDFLSFIS